ncbi:MAG TPA: hypothetical protein VKE91_13750 [Blastocatellia bacterium]|nr:hypothetical protein [Blastocatellia bacterium]
MRKMILCSMLASGLWTGIFAYRQSDKAPNWLSDKSLADRLDAFVDMEEFQMKVPKNYQPVNQLGPDGSKITAWVGDERSDGTKPYVMVSTIKLNSEQRSKLSLEQALDTFLTSIERRRKDWNRAPAERGKVNGMTFVRSRWSGTDLTTEKKMRGFNYVTIDNGKLVQISSQDVEPHDKEALELAEAAALTFIKK